MKDKFVSPIHLGFLIAILVLAYSLRLSAQCGANSPTSTGPAVYSAAGLLPPGPYTIGGPGCLDMELGEQVQIWRSLVGPLTVCITVAGLNEANWQINSVSSAQLSLLGANTTTFCVATDSVGIRCNELFTNTECLAGYRIDLLPND